MDSVRAVKDPEPDPKAGRPRPTSGVSFPYYGLADSIEVAREMHERAGGTCDLAQLSSLLGYSGVKNGAFRTRVSAAKMFGLIEDVEGGDDLRVSNRGSAIVAPIADADADQARVDAFLDVELFRKVYERYNGSTLPKDAGLRNLLAQEYQVVKSRVAPTIRIMLDSADDAGFFKMTNGDRSRMVKPVVGSGAGAVAERRDVAPEPSSEVRGRSEATPGHGGGGGGNGTGGDLDPAILGLLQKLPPSGTPLTDKRRAELVNAFTALVAFIYPSPEDEG